MSSRDVGIGLTVAGVDVLDYAIERLRVVWGRGDLYSQPDVSSVVLTLDVDRAGWLIDELPFDVGSPILVTAPLAGEATETVYVGTVDDMELEHDDDTGHTMCKVTGDDLIGRLANTFIGDVPWPEESAIARAERIVAALPAGIDGYEAEFGAISEAFWLVRERDVDRQPALSLMQEIAASTDTGLYIVNGEPGETALKYLFHSLALDHPGQEFVESGGTYVVQQSAGVQEVTISASHLALPVKYTKGLAQLITEAEVAYWDTVAAADATVIVKDIGQEALHGARSQRIRTVLVDEADADTLAGRALLRGKPSWRTDTLLWDADDGDAPGADPELTFQRFLRLRDRVGLAAFIDDMPAWVPSSASYVFIEGGALEYLADDIERGDGNVGRWIVTMAVIPTGAAGRGITYAEALSTLPGMTYTNIDSDVSYIDALAVGV